MPLDEELLAILACPLCKGDLIYLETEDKLKCKSCPRIYSIKDNIPVMLIGEAEVDLLKAAEILPGRKDRPRTNNSPELIPFSATYFPWSVILNENTLKRALLYFDKIFLLTPGEEILDKIIKHTEVQEKLENKPNVYDEAHRAIVSFYKKIKPLMDAGLIISMNPDQVVSNSLIHKKLEDMSFDDVINYEANRLDPQLSFLVNSFRMDTGEVSSYLSEYSASGHGPSGEAAFQYWEDSKSKKMYPNIEKRVEDYINKLPLQARAFMKESIKIPDAIVRALIINTSLLCIEQSRSVPFTDNTQYLHLIVNKYRRIFDPQANPQAGTNLDAMYKFTAESRTKSGMLANFVLDLLVPNIDYENFEDVLDLRERFDDHLQLFRMKMISLSTNITNTIADPDFYEYCQQVILKEIVPPLLELQKNIKLSNITILKKFINGILSLKPTIPFIISAFTPLPLYAAALVAGGILSLDTALDLYIERRKYLYNNGLAYLLDISKEEITLDDRFWTRSDALAAAYHV